MSKPLAPRAESIWTSCSDFLFPRRCGLCRRLHDHAICDECLVEMPSDESPIASMPDLDAVASVFQYEGRAAQAIRNLKYHRITSLARPMSRLMAQTLEQQSWDIDLVVPVPIHFSRRCARGFNQAELLCEAISQSQSKKSLLRIRRTPPQVGLSRDRRLTNLIGAFRAMPEVADKSVLLVDDVITTGTTASECARMLRTAGASRVFGLVFARG